MKLRTLLAASTMAALFASTAIAATDEVVNAIAQDLVAQGYTRIEIKNGPFRVQVEAFGPDGSLERTYDENGIVLREEIRAADGTEIETGDDEFDDEDEFDDDEGDDNDEFDDADEEDDDDEEDDHDDDHGDDDDGGDDDEGDDD